MFDFLYRKKKSLFEEEKIFGIGLNKTGTTSLGKVLDILGYNNHTSYNLKLIEDWKSNNFDEIIKVACNNNNFEDWPWPLLYRELYFKFPNSKFILTTRLNSEIWFKSLEKHAQITGPTPARKLIYGYYLPINNKAEHISFYNDHNREVHDFFSGKEKNRFLPVCWENGDSWEKICNFLNRPIPKNVPFPHLNKAIDNANS